MSLKKIIEFRTKILTKLEKLDKELGFIGVRGYMYMNERELEEELEKRKNEVQNKRRKN